MTNQPHSDDLKAPAARVDCGEDIANAVTRFIGQGHAEYASLIGRLIEIAEAALKAEREAAAVIADSFGEGQSIGAQIAAAIRCRP